MDTLPSSNIWTLGAVPMRMVISRIRSNCAYADVTTDKIYRDHLVSSVLNEGVRDKLCNTI